MTPPPRPLPDTDDPLTAPFWAAAREQRLVMPECERCGYLQWPPEVLCPQCQYHGRRWREFPAGGALWSYTIYHRAMDPAFADAIPYAVGLVELDCGRKMYGLMTGDHSGLVVGARVRGVFVPATSTVTFLQWQVCGSQDAGSCRPGKRVS